MIAIFKKEISAFLSSLMGYIIIGAFLVAVGLVFWVFPENSVLNYGFAEMSSFFDLTPYVFIFLIPAITMRLFSEELKSGTIELLLTKPLSYRQLIMGKYFAACFLVLLALMPTVCYAVSLYQMGSPVGNLDIAGIATSYIGLFLLGAVFTAIGLLASSLTDNQVVAFVVGVFICFLLYIGTESMASLAGSYAYFVTYLSLSYHYDALGRGLIDSRNIVFFLSIIFLALGATYWQLQKRFS